jgi:L-seryl-tRNA(Ser) seleniumtransferase
MIATAPDILQRRAEALASELSDLGGAKVRVAEGHSVVGGGTFPGVELPGWTVRLARSVGAGDTSLLASALRGGDPPVAARVEDGEVVLDLRTVDPDDDELLVRRLREVL